jgi:hypothetical protein
MLHNPQLELMAAIFLLLVASAAFTVWRSANLYAPPLPVAAGLALRAAGLRTGDLLLWSAETGLLCDVQKFCLNTHFTHVSLVYVAECGTAYAWESLRPGGVALNRLDARLASGSSGQCFVRRISRPLDAAQRAKLQSVFRGAAGAPYVCSFWRAILHDWCSAYVRVPAVGEADEIQWRAPRFCSHLVADTYAHCGVLDYSGHDKPSSMAMPADFGAAAARLPLRGGYAFGPEEPLSLRGEEPAFL